MGKPSCHFLTAKIFLGGSGLSLFFLGGDPQFPLIRPNKNPYFLGGVRWGGGRLTSHDPKFRWIILFTGATFDNSYISYPIPSMYGIFTYIYHTNQPNVGKYTIHGSYGYMDFMVFEWLALRICPFWVDSFGMLRLHGGHQGWNMFSSLHAFLLELRLEDFRW